MGMGSSGWRRGMFPAGALLAAALVGGCSTNPATGQRVLAMQSWEWERSAGAEASPQLTSQFGGPTPDDAIQSYVNEVGRKLLDGLEEGVPELEWEFTMVDSAVINAFALPGGKVFFSRGLAEALSSESEMAGVLGHEIGHVTARHANQRVSQSMITTGLLAGAALAVGIADPDSAVAKYGSLGVPALAVGGNLVLLSYGRSEELEADWLGIRYMTLAGYDPVGQRMVMETLRDASSGGSPPEWLSTHPASATRINEIDELLEGPYAVTQNNPEYVMNEDAYQRRMLMPLRNMPPATHTAMGDGQVPWCAVCDAIAFVESAGATIAF